MRVVSGIQPTGQPHLGNYLGAIRNYVRLQDEAVAAGGECLIFLADLHALSMPHDPAELHASTLDPSADRTSCCGFVCNWFRIDAPHTFGCKATLHLFTLGP